MAKLSRDEVLKLAQLARLELSSEELDEFAAEFEQILTYVDQLQQADTTGLEQTHQVSGLNNVTRADEVKDYGYNPKDLLKNVPEVKDDQIKTRRMVD